MQTDPTKKPGSEGVPETPPASDDPVLEVLSTPEEVAAGAPMVRPLQPGEPLYEGQLPEGFENEVL